MSMGYRDTWSANLNSFNDIDLLVTIALTLRYPVNTPLNSNIQAPIPSLMFRVTG